VLSGLPPMPQSPLATPLYDDPGHRAHVLAFDRDHRVGEALDDLALLVGREDVLDERDVDDWHGSSWSVLGVGLYPMGVSKVVTAVPRSVTVALR
jgi:hypothetical protein